MSVVGGHEIRNRNVVFTKYDGPDNSTANT